MGTVKYSGPVASFHCPTEATIRSLKVHFSPKQLGEGTPSPDNVRPIEGWDGVKVEQRGKNLFDANNPNIITPNCWVSSNAPNKITASGTDRTVYIKCLPNTTYNISKTLGNVLAAGYTTELPATNMQTYSYMRDSAYARQVTVTTGSDAKYLAIWFYDSSKTYDRTVQPEDIYKTLQVEYGSTATIYESYHGSTTNYEFGVLGKNKFDYTNANIIDAKRRDDNGNEVADGSGSYSSALTQVSPSTTYTASGFGTNLSKRVYYIDADENFLSRSDIIPNNTFTFTTPSNCHYVQFQSGRVDSSTWSDVQLELGSTATTYEPYDPNKTVYGGWVDLVSGEVCEEYHKMIIDKDSKVGIMPWLGTHTDPTTGEEFTAALWKRSLDDPKAAGYGRMKCYCDQYPYHNLGTSTRVMNTAGMYDGDTYGPSLMLPISLIGTTKESLAEFMQDKTFTFVYQLKEPIYYNLPPHSTELKTFLAQNNVWSNADYVEVEYDLHETQGILARKQFIIANQPHIETLAAAPLQNFVTDMKAPIKECKVHFEPVQEGSGDPSPDNVRSISGWTGLEIYRTGRNLANVPNPYTFTRFEELPINLLPPENYMISGITTSTDTDEEVSTIRLKGITARTYGASFLRGIPQSGLANVNYKPEIERINAVQMYAAGNLSTATGDECTWRDVQVELGKMATTYEPYIGTTIPITFPSEAGTIYGGYVDLTTGEVVQTCYNMLVDSNTTIYRSNFTHDVLRVIYQLPYTGADKNALMCNQFGLRSRNSAMYNYPTKGLIALGDYNAATTTLQIGAPDGITTQTEWESWLADNSPIQVIYELNEPIRFPIDPQTLKTLRGTNNIWSNSNGDITVQFWRH